MIDIKGFIIAILPIALSPGASFTLAISNISSSGLLSSFKVILGTGIGILLHGLLVGLGVSSLVAKSNLAMSLLQLFGVGFLFWLGLKLILNGYRSLRSKVSLNNSEYGVKESLFLNLFNAKAVILYLTVVPIFAGTKLSNYLILSMIHIAIMTSWILVIGFGLIILKEKIKLTLINGVVNTAGGIFLLFVSFNTAFALYN